MEALLLQPHPFHKYLLTQVQQQRQAALRVMEALLQQPVCYSNIAPSTTNPVPQIFYPFGLEAGETQKNIGEENSYLVNISSPFIFFGRAFSQIYVNGNGFLSFKQPLYELENFVFPAAGSEDLIAPLYTDIDDYMSGVVSYHEYTNGSVLTRASQEINQYFSRNDFNANWVFVATWNYGSFYGGKSLFQVVLISGGNRSFVLMNYGDMEEAQSEVQAGYNTANSEHYFVIPHSNEFNYLPNLKYSSNVNVPGRWFFSVSNEILIGLRMTIRSFSDLTQTGNIETVLKQLKQELINRGVSNTLDLKLRAVKKTNP
ncbi:sushi, nidogen and EGF-like domain-containing protein 1 isoform X2 [Xyrauchen texanus]|uniref:sushi, nidogen and EGF-like domain-containing protein 1 isoform X2 n=1 Tax=Xyrauchen texanus TaxID=154827 RepID=UPI002242C355|nr:sushi, nidogen and EGF-like domain-containing protein 1 isoform X2 [Xyrauchen texanus]XP_051959527.1 sushi, nidogen and EGF-like domain-containing protein 1 isoform X2 [Xyrauchen texanus]